MTTESQNDIMNIENIESEIKNNRREILKSEKMLLIIALIISILCDRLFFNIIMKQAWNIFYFTAIFETR